MTAPTAEEILADIATSAENYFRSKHGLATKPKPKPRRIRTVTYEKVSESGGFIRTHRRFTYTTPDGGWLGEGEEMFSRPTNPTTEGDSQ